MNPAIRNLLLTLIALAVIIGGYFYYRHTHPASGEPSITASTTSQTLPDGTVITGLPAGATITEVDPDQDTNIQVPDYTKPIVFSANLDANTKAAIEAQFEQVTSAIAKTPADFDSWIRLGTLRKIAGDYQGAAEDWQYMADVYGGSTVPHMNLADLYENFLKDYPKAEVQFKEAIKIKPDYVEAYVDLYTMYKNLYKTDTSAAADILEEGLKNNPNNAELLQLKNG